MSCLIDFLTDEKQKSLINMVQNREETFESELESYKRLFMVEIEPYIDKQQENLDIKKINGVDNLTIATGAMKESICSEYNRRDFCRDENCYFADACSNIYTILCSIQKKRIEHFFQGIQYCYTCWIDSQTTIALETFDSLLKEYGVIFDGAYDENDELLIKNITERVFFRGRITSQFLGKMDMFHVPYNKRYNLHNERFSLTGQPILYLGNSIADVMEELDIDIDDNDALQHLKISSFEFLISDEENEEEGAEKKKKIFDLRCNIWQDMKNIKKCTFTEKKFFRNILSAICSFQKRKELEGYAFKEEYVIPQMLAQVLKQNHYDGICYYSTKRFHKYHLDEVSQKVVESEMNMRYRENVAIFTNVIRDDELQFYDKKLRNCLEISMPIGICNVKESSEDELFRIYQSIKEHCIGAYTSEGLESKCVTKNSNQYADNSHFNLGRRRKADAIVNFYSSVFSKLQIGGKPYIETNCGKIHLQLLIGILNRILVESEVNTIKQYKTEETPINVPLEIIQCCDIFGKPTEMKNVKLVHNSGELHKGQIIFIIQNSQIISKIRLAMYKKTWDTLFYGHPESMREKLNKHGLVEEREKEEIGSFIYRDVSTTDWPKTGFALKDNHEYVEVFISELTDNDNLDDNLVLMPMEELIERFSKEYKKFSSVYQQALLILINYFYKRG